MKIFLIMIITILPINPENQILIKRQFNLSRYNSIRIMIQKLIVGGLF
jgi:hypothetical protein